LELETVSKEQSPLPEPVGVPSYQVSEQIDTKHSQPASDKETDLPNSRTTSEISAILDSSDVSPANSSFLESSLSHVIGREGLPDTVVEEASTGDISAVADGKEDIRATSVIDETCVAAEKSAVSEASKPVDTSLVPETAVVFSDSAAAETFVGGPASTTPQTAMDVSICVASDTPVIEDKSSLSSSGVTECSSVETVVVADSSTDSSVLPKISLVQETSTLVQNTALVKETMPSSETELSEETLDVEETKSVLEETNKNAQEAKNVEEITHVQEPKNVPESNNAEESKNDDHCKNVEEVKNVMEMETSSVEEETIKTDESSMIQNTNISQEAEERMTQSVLKSSISLRNVAQSTKLSPSIAT
jgi:hypothetical protein